MAYRPPRPLELRPVMVSCQIPRELAHKLQALAETQQCSLSKILRETIVEAFRDDRSE
jgi:predicted transcriptional regulator